MRCSQGFLHGVSGELIWSSILICVLISFSLIKYMKRTCCKSFVCFTPTEHPFFYCFFLEKRGVVYNFKIRYLI